MTKAILLLLLSVSMVMAQPIDSKDTVKLGDIRQLIWVKGHNREKPLLLFLHGGPGNSMMPYAHKFCNELYKHFVVVHWDQRETGATLKINAVRTPLSLDAFYNDAEQLVDLLLKRFQRERLYIVGHSWGTALGFHLVKVKHSQIEAFISIGSMVNQIESEKMALTVMRHRASVAHDTAKVKTLDQIHIPFNNPTELYYHRKALLELNGSKTRLSKDYVESWGKKWLKVFNEASAVNLFTTLPVSRCSIYFIAGRYDLQTNSDLSHLYFEKLEAPAKDFFWIEKAGHSIPSSHGKEMQNLIIDKILKIKN